MKLSFRYFQKVWEGIRAGKGHGFTFLLIPHRTGTHPPFQFHLSLRWFYGLLGLSLVTFLFFLGSFFYSVRVAGELEHYRRLRVESKDQKQKIQVLDKKTAELKQTVQKLNKHDLQLRKLLGLPTKVGRVESVTPNRGKIQLATATPSKSVDQLLSSISELSARVQKREKSFDHLLKQVFALKERFSALPSTWPVRGELSSTFGYRRSPWRGFHSGIDIRADYGTPVRATADGTVIWSGWESGYGRSVVIRHGFGFMTRYGHNSRLAVTVGAKIRKGTVIAYVGSTGHSTGPHVHYEVLRYGSFLNPYEFLDLSLATASRFVGGETGYSF